MFTLPWDDIFDEDEIDEESDVESCCSDVSPEWERFESIEQDENNTQMTAARMHRLFN